MIVILTSVRHFLNKIAIVRIFS